MGAITLNEYLKNAKTDYGASVIKDLLRISEILATVRVSKVSGLRVVGLRWSGLPTVAKRKLGGSYTPSQGTKEPIEETLSIYGGKIQIDRILLNAKNQFKSELEVQSEMLVTAFGAMFNYDFINGDHGVDPDGFEGLKKRIGGMPSRMTINLESGGVSLDVGASAANQHTFVSALHKAKRFLGGKVDHWYTNERNILGISETLRKLNLVDITKDTWEREWEMILGGKLVDVGLKGDQATEVITNTEGTDSIGSSLYGVRMGDEEGLNVIQLNGTSIEPYDPYKGAEINSTPAIERQIDVALGLKNFSNYSSIVRITGFEAPA